MCHWGWFSRQEKDTEVLSEMLAILHSYTTLLVLQTNPLNNSKAWACREINFQVRISPVWEILYYSYSSSIDGIDGSFKYYIVGDYS